MANPIRIDGDTVYLGLGRGLEAMIDLADLTLITSHSWHAIAHHHGRFYVRSSSAGYMHRFLLELSDDSPLRGDHRDGDPFNNRRSNLRVATNRENSHNKGVASNSKTGVRGVSIEEKAGVKFYRATVRLDYEIAARKWFEYSRAGLEEAAQWIRNERRRIMPFDEGVGVRDLEAALAAAPAVAAERPGPARGSGHGRAKLCEADVIAIRRMARAGAKQADLAHDFNVGDATISDIVHRKLWTHIP